MVLLNKIHFFYQLLTYSYVSLVYLAKILFHWDHYRLQNTELFSKNDKFGQKITKNANNVKFVTKKRQIW